MQVKSHIISSQLEWLLLKFSIVKNIHNNADKNVEEKETLIHCWWYSHCGERCGIPQETKPGFTINCNCAKSECIQNKMISAETPALPILIVALFTTAQLRCGINVR